jgi:hypothetical protein
MKTSKILLQAKAFLATNSEELRFSNKMQFICHAVNRVLCHPQRKEALKKIIQGRLNGYTTLELWLLHIHKISILNVCQPGGKDHYDKMQATRHAWLDSMIAEFQAKGD